MRVELLTRATGMRDIEEPKHAGYLAGTASDRADSIVMIEEYIERFAHYGYEPQNDYWWCRNRNEGKLTILVIRA